MPSRAYARVPNLSVGGGRSPSRRPCNRFFSWARKVIGSTRKAHQLAGGALREIEPLARYLSFEPAVKGGELEAILNQVFSAVMLLSPVPRLRVPDSDHAKQLASSVAGTSATTSQGRQLSCGMVAFP